MVNKSTAAVLILGFLILLSGLSLWVLGDQTNSVVSLPLASTGVLWAPLLWICGIIVLLSAAFANILRAKYYLLWLVSLIVGYIVIFGIIVAITASLIP
ncbi:MAG TPA: hypothetical protein VED86_00755 [archaeon]|nr:hypothetical protein [archaeon]